MTRRKQRRERIISNRSRRYITPEWRRKNPWVVHTYSTRAWIGPALTHERMEGGYEAMKQTGFR